MYKYNGFKYFCLIREKYTMKIIAQLIYITKINYQKRVLHSKGNKYHKTKDQLLI